MRKTFTFLLLVALVVLTAGEKCSVDQDCGSVTRYKVCHSKECIACAKDNDCEVNEDDKCHADGRCEMKPYFHNMSVREVFAMLCVGVGAIVAAGGGLGGGGIFVPVFILVLGLNTKAAAALSQATIFGGSLVNLYMNFQLQHPVRRHRPLPDLNTILILEPMLLVGTVVGVLLNILFPPPLILVCLVVVLGYSAWRTWNKGLSMWKKESEETKAAPSHAPATGTGTPSPPLTAVVPDLGEAKEQSKEDSKEEEVISEATVVTVVMHSEGSGSSNANGEEEEEVVASDVSEEKEAKEQETPLLDAHFAEETGDERVGATAGVLAIDTVAEEAETGDATNNNDSDSQHNASMEIKLENEEIQQLTIEDDDAFPLMDSCSSQSKSQILAAVASKSKGHTEALSGERKFDESVLHSNESMRIAREAEARRSQVFLQFFQKCGLKHSDTLRMTDAERIELKDLVLSESEIQKPLAFMCIVWLIVSLFAVMKRGLMFDVSECGAVFWLLQFLSFPFLFLVSWFVSRRTIATFERKRQLGWMPCVGDVHWTLEKGIYYPAIGGMAGLFGGLLGIGGGMIVSPLLLELGVLPRVAAATSAIAVAVTSSSTTLQVYFAGMLRFDYMLFFMSVGIVSTFVGQTVVDHVISKYGRHSIVVFAIAGVITLAVLLMTAQGIVHISTGDATMKFSSAC